MTTPRPSLTIFSDASFCIQTKAAGWAAWMKGNGRPSKTIGGQITKAVDHSYDAETFAAVNALYAARSLGYLTAGDVVMLQSDSLHTLNVICGHLPGTMESKHADGMALQGIRAKRLKKADHAALGALRQLMSETPIQIIVRHVRGHQEGRGRAWVNNECDRIAKEHMREARRAARQQQPMEITA